MQTRLSAAVLSTEQGREADAILRRCVHCGFCNATCPTYQLLGDELDGPRGRIYLIKQFLEGEADGSTARQHLDRCLTCRNCETTCPSGVEYSRLLDIGREQVEQAAARPWSQRLLRWGLLQVVPFPARFAVAGSMGRALQFLLPFLFPEALRKAIPPAAKPAGQWPAAKHARRVLLLDGCVQSVAAPEINAATARLLDRLGIRAIRLWGDGCCGALNQHLNATKSATAMMRRNIDAWWPYLKEDADEPVEAIVSSASACGLQVKDYAQHLRSDTVYAEKAKIVSARVKDVAELLGAEPLENCISAATTRVAFHAPCTLQHGQRLSGVVEAILTRCGFELTAVKDGHLCCGSAGTYSIFQPALSAQLQGNKLAALQAGSPTVIASANIGCLLHLRAEAGVPVKHWVELLADCLSDQ